MTLEELEKKVRTLDDIEEIKNLHREYIFWLNNRQFEEMIDCFSKNATVEIRTFGPRKGREEIVRLFKEEIETVNPRKGSALVQPVITVEGDTAKGHWLMFHFSHSSVALEGIDRLAEWEQGRYDCEYVREGGKWKFSFLKWTCPWPEQQGQT